MKVVPKCVRCFQELIREPVVLADGYTYEVRCFKNLGEVYKYSLVCIRCLGFDSAYVQKSAILEYVKKHHKSPKTGEIIPEPIQLLPNRKMIEAAEEVGIKLSS